MHRAPWPRAAELLGAVNGTDPAVLDVVGSALAEVRKAKSEQRRSQRSEVASLLVKDLADRVAALRMAEQDLRDAGHIRSLVLGEAPERLITVELAAAD